jgi:hypothetical protein
MRLRAEVKDYQQLLSDDLPLPPKFMVVLQPKRRTFGHSATAFLDHTPLGES